MTKRLESVKIESNEKNRILFRETLFSSKAMKECIGGVILYDETIRQQTMNGKSIPELLNDSDSIPGIKVDTGAKKMAGSLDEKITEGLDGLRDRLKDYSKLGAKFTKWRGVFNITKEHPSKLSINVHFSVLPKYRGASPIQSALLNGDNSSGISIIKMSESLDGGDIISSFNVKISPDDNKLTLEKKLTDKCIEELPEILHLVKSNKIEL